MSSRTPSSSDSQGRSVGLAHTFERQLRDSLGAHDYETWFRGVPCRFVEPDTFLLIADNSFRRKCLKSKFGATIQDVADRVHAPGANVRVELRDETSIPPGGTSAAMPDRAETNGSDRAETNGSDRAETNGSDRAETNGSDRAGTNGSDRAGTNGKAASGGSLHPAFTFETFVVGASSRVAHAAALAVSEHPGKTYNPVSIHGPSGVGKSHLLHALAHRISQTSNLLVLMTTGEAFTNRYIHATQNHALDDFLEDCAGYDVLLIDDVQFLSDKKKTQDALLEISSNLLGLGRQIVLTSDRKPLEIEEFSGRLANHLRGGLEVKLELPDYETRVAVAKARAAQAGRELPAETAEFLADQVTTSLRELEGALTGLTHVADLHSRPLSIEMARLALRDFLPEGTSSLEDGGTTLRDRLPSTDSLESGALAATNSQGGTPTVGNPSGAVNADDVIQVIADYFEVPLKQILSPVKIRTVVKARQIGMFLTRELTPLSLAQVGKRFGGRDHTTVLYALRCVEKLVAKKPELLEEIELLRTRISNRRR